MEQSKKTSTPQFKRCTKCGETKQTTEFHKDASKGDGLHGLCKICLRAINLNWQKEHREYFKLCRHRYRGTLRGKASSARVMARYRAKLRREAGISFGNICNNTPLFNLVRKLKEAEVVVV